MQLLIEPLLQLCEALIATGISDLRALIRTGTDQLRRRAPKIEGRTHNLIRNGLAVAERDQIGRLADHLLLGGPGAVPGRGSIQEPQHLRGIGHPVGQCSARTGTVRRRDNCQAHHRRLALGAIGSAFAVS